MSDKFRINSPANPVDGIPLSPDDGLKSLGLSAPLENRDLYTPPLQATFANLGPRQPELSPEDLRILESGSPDEEQALLLRRSKDLLPTEGEALLAGAYSPMSELHNRAVVYMQSHKIPISGFVDSGGQSCVVLTHDSAYQFYNPHAFKAASQFPEDLEGFVKKQSTDAANNLIVWEKITPLLAESRIVRGSDAENTLLKRAHEALTRLHKKGFTHGDATLDNLGLSATGDPLWFDFNMSRKVTDSREYNRDFDTLEKSVRHHGAASALLTPTASAAAAAPAGAASPSPGKFIRKSQR